MRVLLTGATGCIGSHTAAALRESGHDAVALVRDPGRLDPALDPHGVSVEQAVESMTDADAVTSAMKGCDAVVHTAGEISLDGASADVGAVDLDGARAVFDDAVEHGVDPIVYTSTLTAYLPADTATIDLDTPLAEPVSAYGADKRDVELLAQKLQEQDHPVTTFVLGGVYGPISPHLDSSFGAILGAIEILMLVPPGGLGVLDVRDTAAMLAAAVEPGRGPRRYMAGGRFVTWQQWTDVLSAAEGTHIAQQHVTRDDMIQLGRDFDHQRELGVEVAVPSTQEAAEIMTAGVPTDDTQTLEDLGIEYRPTEETFADTIQWLRSTGRLPAR